MRRNKETLSKIDEEQLEYGEKHILNDEVEYAVAKFLTSPPGFVAALKAAKAEGNMDEYWRKLRNQNYNSRWYDQDPFNYTNRKLQIEADGKGLHVFVKGGPKRFISYEDISWNYVDVVFPADYYRNISQNIATGLGEARVKILDDRTSCHHL